MTVIETIAPIFIIIIFGFIIRKREFLKDDFVAGMNRFVFLLPLPLLIFTGIVRSNIEDVSLAYILSVIIPTIAVTVLSFLFGVMVGLKRGRLGSFVQTTFHGNVTYVGLAVLFYVLGDEGLKRGSILIGFLILLNNALSIGILSLTSHTHKNAAKALLSIFKTPVIIATFAGIINLYCKIPIPSIIFKSMTILGNVALPMALLIIGASISIDTLKKSFWLSVVVSGIKLVVLPGLAFMYCKVYCMAPKEALPSIILLATPTALTSFILAKEVGGDPELASGAVTLSTLVSPFTFALWTSTLL
ncbi:MAG TPA: AEC family transporter [Syntrophorhabdaceae bacterium]|jgi:hypothetical protein|nr:AEC family transporter [Pseudomonadota bacterium]HNQ63037.1 AEC family transporter [Syntrophorhabdaceae bacterium]HPH41583.1 AEC family transporter [Syntrophorhabdaceae bacterium]